MKKQLMLMCLCAVSIAASAAVVNFEEFVLDSNSYYPTLTSGETGFSSQDVSFPYFGNVSWNSWDGFVCSNVTDNTTPSYSNQYSAITGKGVDNSENYVVVYPGYSTGYITVPTNSIIQGAYFTNTTYAALDMQNGSMFSKKFGAGDFFKLIITGWNADNEITGSVVVDLASGTNILAHWLWADLSGLGLVKKLEFSFESSDTSVYDGVTYINTPTYFAMDNLTYVIPEPATLLILGAGIAAVIRRRNHA